MSTSSANLVNLTRPWRKFHLLQCKTWFTKSYLLGYFCVEKINHADPETKLLITYPTIDVRNTAMTSIGSDNDLAPTRRQAIIWTNDGMFTEACMRHPVSMS